MQGKMKAAVLESLGNIQTKMVDIPQISDDEVLVKVKYAGICGSDIPRSMITGARLYPLILGHEFSGTVAKTGKNVRQLAEGDRVVVAPLIPCRKCIYCQEGNYGLCEQYTIIGTGCDGAFAEYTKVPQEHVLKIPDHLDLESACGVEPATIGFFGLQKAKIQPGETVVVMGCGSIGQLTLQWAKIFGASKVIAVDIFDDKLELAKELGADITINSKKTDPIREIKRITNGGADVVAETAGSAITQQQSILAARKRGRVVFIGITHKGLELTEDTVDHIMRGEITIQGSWNSYTSPYPGFAWKAAIDFLANGKINFKKMVSHKIPVEEVGVYLKEMANRSINYNKVLVCFED